MRHAASFPGAGRGDARRIWGLGPHAEGASASSALAIRSILCPVSRTRNGLPTLDPLFGADTLLAIDMSCVHLDFMTIHWNVGGCWTEATGSGISDAQGLLNDSRFREISAGDGGRSAFAVLSPSEALEIVRRGRLRKEHVSSHILEEELASINRVESTLARASIVIARVRS